MREELKAQRRGEDAAFMDAFIAQHFAFVW
jgi:hypothetical protein